MAKRTARSAATFPERSSAKPRIHNMGMGKDIAATRVDSRRIDYTLRIQRLTDRRDDLMLMFHEVSRMAGDEQETENNDAIVHGTLESAANALRIAADTINHEINRLSFIGALALETAAEEAGEGK